MACWALTDIRTLRHLPDLQSKKFLGVVSSIQAETTSAGGVTARPGPALVADKGPSSLEILIPALWTSSRIAISLASMRLEGPDTLTPPITRPC